RRATAAPGGWRRRTRPTGHCSWCSQPDTAAEVCAVRSRSGALTAQLNRSGAGRLDDVPGAAHRVDQLRLHRVDLLAQVADVELDDVRLPLEVVLPHPVEDLRL